MVSPKAVHSGNRKLTSRMLGLALFLLICVGCRGEPSIQRRRCTEFSGQYVTPREDGRTWFAIRQEACSSIVVVSSVDGVAGPSADTLNVSLDGQVHPRGHALLDASIVGDTLRITTRAVRSLDTVFVELHEWVHRWGRRSLLSRDDAGPKDICFRRGAVHRLRREHRCQPLRGGEGLLTR